MKTIFRLKSFKTLILFFYMVLLGILSGPAHAEIIDDISFKTDVNGEVDAVIKFVVPIQYLRHFPRQKSQEVAIYFNVLANVSRDQWQDYESHRSPPSELIRSFTVTTRDLSTGPKIEIQFTRPAEFSVTPGRDNQTLLLHFKPEFVPQKKEGGVSLPGAGTAAVVAPLAVVAPIAPAAVPVPAAKPVAPAAAPEAVQSTTPTAKTPAAVPVSSVAAAPAVISAPAPAPAAIPAPAPEAVLRSNAPQPQLGGKKDGLPLFPRIDPIVPEAAKGQATENLPLAEQVKRANNQAGVLMSKARDAMLSGELFTAIDALNNVLLLPSNKYSADAQLWIGIAREKAGQTAKARSEFEAYLNLYPNGTEVSWTKERLAKLNVLAPAATRPVVKQAPTKFEFTQYGSVSAYYYYGNSKTDTIATINSAPTPVTLSVTDQNALITTASVTGRFSNNEYDNRVVFQGLKTLDFLPNRKGRSRVNAAYYDVKSRVDNISARIGIQSALGGGVLGRFNGVSAGYGFLQNWRANVSAGQLRDVTIGTQPKFYSLGLDFGVNSPLGGSVYFINQTLDGLTDRRATGGNLRYFEQGLTALSMVDYDLQFKALNMLTFQGTLNTAYNTDFNVYFDRRRSPLFSINNAINGAAYTTASSVPNIDPATGLPITDPFTGLPSTYSVYTSVPATLPLLLQNGFSQSDIVDLARKRTAISTIWQFGMTNRIKENWQLGTDLVASNTSGMSQSGTCNPDGTTSVEGCMPVTPATGTTWSVAERLSGNSVFSKLDLSTLSVSYVKGPLSSGRAMNFNNRVFPVERWTIDSTFRLYLQNAQTGTKLTDVAAVEKASYRLRNYLVLETEVGLDRMHVSSSQFYPSTTLRKYIACGFRWDL